MLPAYIIHNSQQTERDDIVKSLVQATGATVVDAVWSKEDPIWGCRESHKKVATLAKEEHPDSAYLVFEDDCEILDPNFIYVIFQHLDVDILYFGINGYCFHHKPFPLQHSWGTHAMMMTPKARDTLLEKEELYLQMPFPLDNHPYDMLLCVLAECEGLKVWKPDEANKNRWVRQKPGLVSSISGSIRV